MPDRTWSHGLHQAVEAWQGLPVSGPTETLARLSFQRFFRLFRRLSGMTGTGREAAPEFWHIYERPLVTIPTNKPCVRTLLPDSIWPDAAQKWGAIEDEIVQVNATGRPVLVGTRSVRASEDLAAKLQAKGLSFNLLNALRDREEAQIVARAGDRGMITIATNMAGRGTDIRLGTGVPELGGLHVIATERHESGRIDRQLFGRCARQGDPGSARAFVCPEDELIRRFAPRVAQKALRWAINAGVPGVHLLAREAIHRAQKNAQLQAFAQRTTVLRTDDWLEEALSFAGRDQKF
jgi:preprotein translocase subunit SecA